MRGLLWLLVSWLAASATVQADDAVVLFERTPLRPGLCAALRIQLSGSAEVRCVADGAAPGLAERLESARTRLRAGGAKLGVLLERDPEPQLVRMYLVGPEGEQAALSIERSEDRPDPDIDRSLALKVREAHELMGFVERELPKNEAAAAIALAAPRATAPLPPPRAPVATTQYHVLVELGGGVSLAGLRGLGSGLLGLGALSARTRFELGVGARLASRERAREGDASVRLAERGLLLAARMLYRSGRFELGGALQLYLAFTAAEAAGVRAEKQVITPVLGLAPDLRMRLFPLAYLRFAPSLEFATVRQKFAVDGDKIIERGHVGTSLVLALLITLPVRPTPQGLQP